MNPIPAITTRRLGTISARILRRVAEGAQVQHAGQVDPGIGKRRLRAPVAIRSASNPIGSPPAIPIVRAAASTPSTVVPKRVSIRLSA